MKNTIKKLLILFVTIISFAFTLVGCGETVNLDEYISQLRLSVYEGESQNFKVVCYAEKRETPFNADGVVGEIKNAVIIKVSFLNGAPNDANATLSYGSESYQTALNYNPVSEKSNATVYVENLPSLPSINIEITSGDICEKVTLSSVIFDNTVTYSEALKSVINSDKEKSNRLFGGGEESAEIHVRLIRTDGKNYYYVGIVEKGGKTSAYLVDGETATILAKKDIGR